jgi:quercetin dioxygenase-like cupin family protein
MKRIIAVASVIVLFGCKTTQMNSKLAAMNLKELHTELKDVQTALLFTSSENKVVSLQILKGKQLSEHVTKVPAVLVCVSGKGSYADEKGKKVILKIGDYIKIEPNIKHWVDAFEDSNFLLIK